ncbi:MAG TPA: hypothetical protein VFG87_28040 [Amycolatopsis sp.]|jgi:hypothetical protein|nr:hypothetical protein [Amycolatopsis sp.]
MTFNPTVLLDAYISINSNVISDHGNKAEIPIKAEAKMATTFGQTWNVRRGGLKDGNLNFDFLNDYVAGNLDEIMWALVGTVVPFEVRAASGTVTTSNPKYTGNVFIDQWTPIIGKVGDLVTVSVGWPTSGTVTRGTS